MKATFLLEVVGSRSANSSEHTEISRVGKVFGFFFPNCHRKATWGPVSYRSCRTVLGMMLGDSNTGDMELNPPVLPSVKGHAARVRLPFTMGNLLAMLAWKLRVVATTQP